MSRHKVSHRTLDDVRRMLLQQVAERDQVQARIVALDAEITALNREASDIAARDYLGHLETDLVEILADPIGGAKGLMALTFASGRRFAVIRRGRWCFDVRWRDAIPGHGTIHIRRHTKPGLYTVVVGWVRGDLSTYVHPPAGFLHWNDAFRLGVVVLNAWIGSPDWRAFQADTNGTTYGDLDIVLRALGLPPVTDDAVEDR